jgi:hypothetical protein
VPLCSPFGGKGRLVATTWVRVLTAETAEAPTQMLAHNQMSTPSHLGREGIDGTSVSHCPEANWMIASWLYYFYCRKKK